MNFLYSHQLVPNSPVDAYTLVGKYDQVVAVKHHKSSSGCTFRATNLHTYFLHVLESSQPTNRHVERRFVDLESRGEPSDRVPRTDRASLDKCLSRPYIQACTVASRVVCFIDSDMRRIAKNYIKWIEHCDGVAEEPVKPIAVIVLCGHQPNKSSEEVAFELFTTTQQWTEVYRQSSSCFQATKVLYHQKLTGGYSKHNAVNWQLLERIRSTSDSGGEQKPFENGYYWREKCMHHLFESSIRYFSRRVEADPIPFSIARTLTSDLPSIYPELPHQLAFFSVGAAPMKTCGAPVLAAILGAYMAHHLLAHCPLLEVENFKTAKASTDGLFDFIFQQRYAHIEEQLVKHATESQNATPYLQGERAKLHMLDAIGNYLGSGACITQTHIGALREHREFFIQQPRPQRLCVGCFFAYWDDVLPCGHGFCKGCTHNYSPQWMQSARLQFKRCPVCQEEWNKPQDVKIQPPTAGGRILSLDGGGVKGVIGLEVLHSISALIGEQIPLHNLFDMAVGTSIGGIAVLGLFVNRWDFETCKWKLSKLTAEILPRRPSTHPVKGRVESMLRYIKYAACIALQRSFVSGGTVQAVLRQEFGKYGSMMFPTALAGAPVKLAVTAWDTRAKCCSIVTSYNRPRLQDSKSYKWVQANDADIDDQVWEAAQCTSAVPFLFPAAQLPGGPLVDGAVTCNNPTRIALQEAKIFWAPEEERNMVLSVGYGAMKAGKPYQDGPVAACRASIVESLSAEKQHTDLVLCGHQYVRLNPTLDIDAVQFDDVSSISRLQDSFRSTLAQDVTFAENIRSAAFQLLASQFYVEIGPSSILHDGVEGYSASAMIRPRIAVSYLKHLYKHERFSLLRFEVQGRLLTFSMPKKISIRVEKAETPIEVRLKSQTNSAVLSGLPASLEKLSRAQSDFYRRKGSHKRRASRTGG